MIIIHVMGGLGNQLYQYAMYEKLKSLGKNVKLDFYAYCDASEEEKEWRPLELTKFVNLEYEVCTRAERTMLLDNDRSFVSKVRRKLFGRKDKTVKDKKVYMPEVFLLDDVYLYGYWICEKYYEDITHDLQKKLIFPQSSNLKNVQCIKQLQEEESVSIHIRRKDYLTVSDGKRYMGICTEDYYASAMKLIREQLKKPVFYIFSDDIEYAHAHYQGKDVHIVDWNTGEDSIFDMQLMSQCKHNICANSTFSIWGARLNQNPDKLMIRPLRHDNYEEITVSQMHDNWHNWILIDAEGNIC